MSLVIDQAAAQMTRKLVWDAMSDVGMSDRDMPFLERHVSSSSSSDEDPSSLLVSQSSLEGEEEESEDDYVVLPPFLRAGTGSVIVESGPLFLRQALHSISTTATARKRTPTKKREPIVSVPFVLGGEQETLERVIQSIPRLRSAWKKVLPPLAGGGDDESSGCGGGGGGGEPVQKRAKSLPNQKFSCKQYTDEFVAWVERVTDVLLSQPGRTYGLRVDDNTITQGPAGTADGEGWNLWMPNTSEELGRNHIVVPGDNRCTGCRRYFKTKTFQRQKDLAFFKCKCDRHRASHCVRCRVLQWALSVPVDEESGEVDVDGGVACLGVGCGVKWKLTDLFIVSVQPPLIVAASLPDAQRD